MVNFSLKSSRIITSGIEARMTTQGSYVVVVVAERREDGVVVFGGRRVPVGWSFAEEGDRGLVLPQQISGLRRTRSHDRRPRHRRRSSRSRTPGSYSPHLCSVKMLNNTNPDSVELTLWSD